MLRSGAVWVEVVNPARSTTFPGAFGLTKGATRRDPTLTSTSTFSVWLVSGVFPKNSRLRKVLAGFISSRALAIVRGS